MNIELRFPKTNEELAEVLMGRDEVRFAAGFDDFWELLADAEFTVEYFNHEIIATMSYESNIHSDIATQISFLLKQFFKGDKQFRVKNGNRPVAIPDCGFAVFNPDASVVFLPGKQFEYSPGMTAELTPTILFEVLSLSTRRKDQTEKLPCYKKIPSLRQIVYVDSQRVGVTVWEKQTEAGQWLESNFKSPSDQFLVEGRTISLQEIYEDTLL